MTRHDPIVRLRHMLDHAVETIDMARGRTRRDLDTDRQLNLALVRLLEIVGEAAARIPLTERRQWPNIPWEDIVGFRNRIVHGYDLINLDVVWAIIERDLPALVIELRKVLAAT